MVLVQGLKVTAELGQGFRQGREYDLMLGTDMDSEADPDPVDQGACFRGPVVLEGLLGALETPFQVSMIR
jgi:hypothetical protein